MRESENRFVDRRQRSRSADSAPRKQEEPTCQVYTSNLQQDCTSDDLMDAFNPYGNVVDLRKKGHFAFIKFDTADNALAAIEGLDGTNFQGQRIKVEKAKPFVPRQ